MYLDGIRLYSSYSLDKSSSKLRYYCRGSDYICGAIVKIKDGVIIDIKDHKGICQGKKTLEDDIAREVGKSDLFRSLTQKNKNIGFKFT